MSKPDYLATAQQYHAYGANVVAIGNSPVEPKKPNHRYTDAPHDYKTRPQTADEVEHLVRNPDGTANAKVNPWSLASGVGIISGVNGWRCIDIDATKDDPDDDGVPFDVVEAICERLGLDALTYEWVGRSGSGRGWHVWFVCHDEFPDALYPGVDWGDIKPNARYAGAFDHLERRWAKCYTVTPPSRLVDGSEYRWRNCEVPNSAPETVDVDQVVTALRAVCDIPTPSISATPSHETTRVALSTGAVISATVSHETHVGEWYDPDTGQTWATLADYDREYQEAKDDARRRFDMVEYIQRHLQQTKPGNPGADYVERHNGETRIGKPGAGFGGWYVTDDGKWYNHKSAVGGDCYALVLYCKHGTTKTSNADQWRDVLATVEGVTGVRFPRRKPRNPTPSSGDGSTPGNDDNQKRRGRPTQQAKAEQGLEFLRPFEFRRNELTHNVEWRNVGDDKWQPLNDDRVNAWRVEFELETGRPCSVDDTVKWLSYVTKPYDPIREYFDALPTWDGTTDHIATLASTAKTDNPALFYDHLTKWLVGTYATGYYGAKRLATINELFLVLHGEQGTGKTTFLTHLVPEPLRDYLYDGEIDTTKDGQMLQAGSFVFMNDELASLRKRDVETIKSLLSKTDYKYRRPYDRIVGQYRRRVSFCGSTNEDQFLADHTGDRRFVVHTVGRVELDALRAVNIDGVWCQAKALYEAGVRHWLNPEEQQALRLRNRRYTEETYADGLLLRYFEPADNTNPLARHLTTSEIAQRIVELYDLEHTVTENTINGERVVRDGTPRPNPERLAWPLGRALKKQMYEKVSMRRGMAGTRWGYWVVEVPKARRDSSGLPGDVDGSQLSITPTGVVVTNPSVYLRQTGSNPTPTDEQYPDDPPF